MTNKILRLALLANLIFAEHAANGPTRSLINQGEQQSAFIAHGSSGVFYQMQGISVTPLLRLRSVGGLRGVQKAEGQLSGSLIADH
jgi:hypothetical protein